MSIKLSIIVPVYNEVSNLDDIIGRLMKTPCPIEREWIFVDDASTDGSIDVLRKKQIQYPFVLIEKPFNEGKGSALREGIKKATGDFIMFQDADFEYNPSDVPSLLVPLLEGKADVVYGSRFKQSGYQVHRTYHYFVNRFLTIASNILSGIHLTDMETCYKVFRADLLKAMDLRSKRFGIEVEVTAYVAKVRARIYELPISYFPRKYLQGKKIDWQDGIAALFHLVRFNLLTSMNRAFHQVPEAYVEPPKRLLPVW